MLPAFEFRAVRSCGGRVSRRGMALEEQYEADAARVKGGERQETKRRNIEQQKH
jgi:hypothetical protein